MEINYTFTGRLAPDFRGLVIDYADQMMRILRPIGDTQLEISIKKFHRQRTVAQNSYIWGIVIPAIRMWQIERTGESNSKEAIYAFLRIKVVGDEPVIEEVDGIDVVVMKGKRFSQCTTVEFGERIDKIIAYYAELGLEIPLPKPKTNNYISDFIER